MSDFVFNVAKGRVRTYAQLASASDGLVVVLLKSSGLEADDALKDHDTLAALLAASNDECDFTGYARKALAGITDVVTDSTNRWDSDANDLTWAAPAGNAASAAGSGAGNNITGKLVICYDPDTGTGSDTELVPLTAHDFVASTDGNELDASLAASGWVAATD